MKFFVDTADTKDIADLAATGLIDGVTTNPTLVSKNPDVMKYLISGKKLTSTEALAEYKKIEAIRHWQRGDYFARPYPLGC